MQSQHIGRWHSSPPAQTKTTRHLCLRAPLASPAAALHPLLHLTPLHSTGAKADSWLTSTLAGADLTDRLNSSARTALQLTSSPSLLLPSPRPLLCVLSSSLYQVAETAVQMFITNDRPNVAGLILAGSAEFKQKLNQSDLFDIRLQAIVNKVVDVSYGPTPHPPPHPTHPQPLSRTSTPRARTASATASGRRIAIIAALELMSHWQ